MNSVIKRKVVHAICVFAFAIAGCSGVEKGNVSGTVTVSGNPVPAGSIAFENAESGISVNANLNPDGTYVIQNKNYQGLPIGTYKVAIKPAVFGDGEAPLAIDPAAEAAPESTIPAKFHSVQTSGLTAEVSTGVNPPFDFNLVP